MKTIKEGLTFSDVLLIPKKTPLESRSEADLRTKFTKNISLNIPLVSSNMAAVTEHRMAIAMAREGGLGIIHQFNKIEEQVEEIKKVKKSTTYVIEDPISIHPFQTIQEGIDLMEKEDITSLIVKTNGAVQGIFTHRDYLFEKDFSRKISDVMTPIGKMTCSRYGISMDEAKEILHKNRIEKLPLLDETGKLKGLITTQDLKKLEYWPNATRDEKGRLRVGAAIGVKDTLERATALVEAGVDVLVLDIAHAHSDLILQKLKQLKETFAIEIMVGNIATADAARDLIEAGADGLKVGIGPSPVCTTRIMAGAGIPQLTAIMDVFEIAEKYGVPVSADGGMKFPGDCAKAIAAGANTIYSGSLFAGTDETPERIIMKNGKRYKRYSGSAAYDSNHELKERKEGRRLKEKIDIFVEGVSILVDYKGPVQEIIRSLCKGIQSGMSYCGAGNIKEMQENSEFVKITEKGWQESLSSGEKLSE